MSPPPTPSAATEASPGLPDDTQWFRESVHPYEPGLRAFLRRRFPGMADIDDLVQDAYARMFKAMGKGRKCPTPARLYTRP